MPRLTVSSLEPGRIDEAYPLIRAATRVTARRWAAYVRLIRHRGGDVVVVTDRDDRIYGTAAFRSGSTLRHPRCLIVDAIAAFEVGELATIKGELCKALQSEAIARGCTAILVQTAVSKTTAEQGSDQWRGLGFTPESMTVVHELRAPREVGTSQDQIKR